ncbi:STAS domain-containing protein [Sphingobacterium hungaricum]|uniref:Anti-anti-sigma factor n=1 Tax=Sphingobacterium hungaricum TaxID=2082723 RepID=A0A928YQ09_9SPHI|nr:STAS domain-containing protein [Sphingobacterium hungaricum]MBE8713459.1 anti-anti-sigma factor [Sphingobacterium hungaricum]
MKFTVDKHDRYVVIQPLSPVLDGDVANKLKAEFMMRNTSGQRNIVLDLSNVEDADENGIRMGILANRLCEAHGGLFILTGLNDKVLGLLELSNLQQFFTIVKSLENAEDLIFGNEIRLDLRGK